MVKEVPEFKSFQPVDVFFHLCLASGLNPGSFGRYSVPKIYLLLDDTFIEIFQRKKG